MTRALRVPVLMYHGLGSAQGAWESRFLIGPRRFADQMAALAQAGFKAVSIDEMLDALHGRGSLPEGAFVLTFDDGFRSVLEHALPVLEQLAWPYSIFLVSDRIGGCNDWVSNSTGGGHLLPLLGHAEVRDMQHRGCTFGSHTCSHAHLSQLSDEQLERELRGSREALSALLDEEVRYLAYPFGDEDERVRNAARDAGYRAAFSTRSGFNGPRDDCFSIRRIEVYGSDSPRMLLRKIRLGSNDGSIGSMARYFAGRVAARLHAAGLQ